MPDCPVLQSGVPKRRRRRCKHYLHFTFSFCCSILALLLKVGCTACLLVLLYWSVFSSSSYNDSWDSKTLSTVQHKPKSNKLAKTRSMKKRIVHLDLKGAPPKPDHYKDLFTLLNQLNFTGVLIEYEDMFPYSGRLASLSSPLAYEPITIQYINTLAAENHLELIPLIQTFGHMEFVLKDEGPFTDLREVPDRADTICPSDLRSLKLVKEMLTQVWLLHPQTPTIHIGSDEAWSIAQDQRCRDKLQKVFNNSTDRLKLDHISNIAKIAKNELKFENVWAWNDMFATIDVELLNEYKLGELLTPVVWGYAENVTIPNYFPPKMFERFNQVFDEVILAGAFKGTQKINSTFMDVNHYMNNLVSYNQLFINDQNQWLKDRLSGIILTGWQRFLYSAPFCELLPVGIPCLIKEAMYLTGWSDQSRAPLVNQHKFLNYLRCKTPKGKNPLAPITYHSGHVYQPPFETLLTYCKFLGSHVFREVEKLRLIRWKVGVDGNVSTGIRFELHQLAKRIKPLLLETMFEESVNEWILQNLDPANI